jgi:BMFP domain-containing protein YqiC
VGVIRVIEKKSLEELLNKINDLIKNSPVQDIQKNVRAVISSWFASHNLVTREEFDAQVEVLRRTQDKLHKLEMELERMDK